MVPDHARPGDTVNIAIAVPNSGWQETWVPITVLLPTNLEALPHTISNGGLVDVAARTIT